MNRILIKLNSLTDIADYAILAIVIQRISLYQTYGEQKTKGQTKKYWNMHFDGLIQSERKRLMIANLQFGIAVSCHSAGSYAHFNATASIIADICSETNQY